jgi:hypothetical protein
MLTPLSSPLNNATYPGLTLKAWAQFVVAATVLTQIKGLNCTVTRSGVGTYLCTFTAALAGQYVLSYGCDAATGAGTPPVASCPNVGTASATVFTRDAAGTLLDVVSMWVGFYE